MNDWVPDEHPAIAEVRRLHVAIADWLAGRDRDVWGAFESVLAAEFEMVVPDGAIVPRPALLPQFESAFGAVPDIDIEIRHAVVQHDDARSAVVRYEEWQLSSVRPNQRISTATFRSDDDAPLGWVWVALHETWLP